MLNVERERIINDIADRCVSGFSEKENKYIINEDNFSQLASFLQPYVDAVAYRTGEQYTSLASELLYHAYRILEKYGSRPIGHPFLQIFRLRVLNILTNNYRKKKRRAKRASFVSISPEMLDLVSKSQHESNLSHFELSEAIFKLLEILGEKEKRLVLCFLEREGNFREIAKDTGFSPCYIRKVLRRLGTSKKVAEVFGYV